MIKDAAYHTNEYGFKHVPFEDEVGKGGYQSDHQ